MRSGTDTPEGSAAVEVTADDFGFTDGVTDGIAEVIADGAVTRTSMMVGFPGWARACALAPGLGAPIGLHLDLVAGAPLERVPSLVGRDGRFLGLAGLAARALMGRVDAAEVEAETLAQVAALRAAGIAVAHLDSHRHSHALPGVRPGVLAAARRAGLSHVRLPVERGATLRGNPRARLQALTLRAWWGARATADLRAIAGAEPRPIVGLAIAGSRSEADARRRIARVIAALPAGPVELVCHPGRVDAALRRLDPYQAPREFERAALAGAAGRALVRQSSHCSNSHASTTGGVLSQ